MSFSKYFCKQNHFKIKCNDYLPRSFKCFSKSGFSHNNLFILGKPEGKEKQGCLEYIVSRATALQLY